MKAPTWCLEGKGIGIRGQAQGIEGKQNRGFFHFEKVHKQKKPFLSAKLKSIFLMIWVS